MKTTPQTLRLAALALALIASGPLALANNAFWIGLPGTSADTNWSDNLNWANSSGGSLGPAGNAVIFNNTNAQSSAGIIDNVVDLNGLNPTSMQYSNGTGFFHTTFIASGVTLTNAGALIIGPVAVGQSGSDAITGPGTLVVNGAVTINPAGGGTDSTMTLDMSGLNAFSNNAPTATMNLATVQQAPMTIDLATNSFIDVATLNIETTGGLNGRNGTMNLGGGENTIWANSINISTGKGATSVIQFNSATTTGSVAIAGTGGTNRANILLGSGSSGSAVAHGNISLAGHFATILASNITMGVVSGSDTGTGDTGTITIDDGTLDAIRILMGNTTTTAGSKASSGTLTIGGSTNTAALIVNSPTGPGAGALVLGNTGPAVATDTATGTLNILTNGTADIYCNISKSNATQNIANINLFAGSLVMEDAADSIGTPGVPIDNLSLSNATITLGVNGTTPNISAGLTLDGTNETFDISSLPTQLIFSYPTAFPLIFYTALNNQSSDNLSVVLPGIFKGVLSNDGVSTIYVVITSGPATVKGDLWKGNISGAWDTTTANWTSSGTPVTYNEGDSVTFDDTAVAKSVTLAVAHSPAKVTMSNAVSAYTFSGAGSISGPANLELDGGGTVTLTETGGDNFSSGITVNAGSLILDNANAAIGGVLSIAAGSTVQIGNNDANGAVPSGGVTDNGSLVFDQTGNTSVGVNIGGTGNVTQAGNSTLTLTGANAFTGNTIVTSGTLALTGAGTIASSSSVDVTNATLDVSAEIAGVTLGALSLNNATLNVSTAYLKTNLNVSSFTTSGAGNTINVSAPLPPVASYPTSIPLVHASSPIGSLLPNLGPLPATTPASAGTLTLSSDQTTVLLTLTSGPTNIRPSTVWGGSDALAAVNTNWSDALNWQSPGAPTTNDNVVFNETGAASGGSAISNPGGGTNSLNLAAINNIVDKDFSVISLTYTNLDGTFQNSFINSGKTLTTGTFAVGSQSLDFGAANTEFVNIIGPNATLTVTNTNSTFNVGLESAVSGTHQATLDLSALGTFNATVSAMEVASVASASTPMEGTLYLAENNNITITGNNLSETSQENQAGLSVAVVGNSGGSANAATLFLGQANVINTGSVAVGCSKDNGTMQFNPSLIGNHPTAKFRGADGVSAVGTFTIGDGFGQTGGSSEPKGTVDFTGGSVDALIGTLNVGRSPNVSGGHVGGTGIFTFEAGTVTVATLNDGFQPFSDTDFGSGTINVNGTGVLNAATLNIGPTTGSTGAPSDIGLVDITGGTVAAGTITGGAGTNLITLNGGTLIVTNTAGSASAPITELDLTGGTLHLSADGNLAGAELNVTAITTNGPTTLDIDSIINVAPLATITNHLIAYTLNNIGISGNNGVDPFGALSLNAKPAGFNVSLVDNTANSTVDLVITSLVVPSHSVITSVSISGTTLNIHATNGEAGQPFVLLGSTNVATPVNQWTNVASGTFGSDGTLTLSTNVVNAATPQQFFIISQ